MPEPDSSLIVDLIRQSLKEGQLPKATIVSDSMAPLLRKGDEILVAPAVLEKLEAGSVLLLAQPNELLAHRFYGMIERNECRYLITRGDRLNFYDPPHPDRYLLGRVAAVKRRGSVLSLDRGLGWRMNQWTTWLSILEARLLGLDESHFEPDIKQQEVVHPVTKKESSKVRLIRRLIYWAELIPIAMVERLSLLAFA